MELIAYTISMRNVEHDESYVLVVGSRLQNLSQQIIIQREDNTRSSPSDIDFFRIRSTAEFYRLAALIYFRRYIQRTALNHPSVQTLIGSALELLSSMELCTSPWPLFIVACEVTEDADRMQILETVTKMERHRRMGNITVVRIIVESLWKQHDLATTDAARANLDWRKIVNLSDFNPSFI